MFTILSKDRLAPSITRMRILAPHIAKKARAGQFVILRAAPDGERIPLTIAETDTAGIFICRRYARNTYYKAKSHR